MQLLDASTTTSALATSLSTNVTVDKIMGVVSDFAPFIGVMVIAGITLTIARRVVAKGSHGKAGF